MTPPLPADLTTEDEVLNYLEPAVELVGKVNGVSALRGPLKTNEIQTARVRASIAHGSLLWIHQTQHSRLLSSDLRSERKEQYFQSGCYRGRLGCLLMDHYLYTHRHLSLRCTC